MNNAEPAGSDRSDAATVYYDGSCPICRAEIGFMDRRDRDGRLAFVDVSDPATAVPSDLERDAAMRRFHVRGTDGVLRSGAAGFASMWGEVPLLRPLARVARVPGVLPILERLYGGFLRVRPRLQPLFRWIERRRA